MCLKINALTALLEKFPPCGLLHSVTWQLNPYRLPIGGGGGKVGGTYLRPKDSNVMVRVCSRATQKAPEGCDRQTNYPHDIVRFFVDELIKILQSVSVLEL